MDMEKDAESGRGGHIPFRLLAPQAFVVLMDAMSYMVTAPSIIFYVLKHGGSYESYGIILSIFSFSSFCFKPVFGHWCDSAGGKYRAPYLTSLAIASLGGLFYFSASFAPSSWQIGPTNVAVITMFVGRLLGGVGAANQSLGYSYVAQVTERQYMTQASAVLSMVRVMGMATAPAWNMVLARIDFTIHIGSLLALELTPLNSVGLFLFIGNSLAFFMIYLLLEEPPRLTRPSMASAALSSQSSFASWELWRQLLCLEIMVPTLAVFVLNVNFQLLETGMAPAASDALGWGPVAVSYLFGGNALVIFLAIICTFNLSRRGTKDETLLAAGCVFSMIGYTCMYLFWKVPTTTILFAIPVGLSTIAFPFMSSPSRSIFTMVVDGKPLLKHKQGMMQALLSMVASIAGFVAPSIISAFVLRTPEEVAASSDGREFAPGALFAPTLAAITLVGVTYVRYCEKATIEEEEEAGEVTETVGLLEAQRKRWSEEEYHPEFDPRTEAARRETVTLMGIPQISYQDYEENQRVTRRQTTGMMASTTAKLAEDPAIRRISNWF